MRPEMLHPGSRAGGAAGPWIPLLTAALGQPCCKRGPRTCSLSTRQHTQCEDHCEPISRQKHTPGSWPSL